MKNEKKFNNCELDDFQGTDAYFQGCLIGSKAKYSYSDEGYARIEVLVEEYSSVTADAAYGLLNSIIKGESQITKEKRCQSGMKSWANNFYNVVYCEDTGEAMVVWQSGRKLIAMGIELGEVDDGLAEDILTAYLEKYPSDLNANSPVPEIPQGTSSSGGSSGGGGGSSTSGGVTVYTKDEIDAKLASSSSGDVTYLDPTACEFVSGGDSASNSKIVVTDNSLGIQCGYDEILERVTHIDCPQFNDNRIIIWSSHGSNSLPASSGYTCVGSEEWNWKRPTQIFGYCCKIKGFTATRDSKVVTTTSQTNGITSTR